MNDAEMIEKVLRDGREIAAKHSAGRVLHRVGEVPMDYDPERRETTAERVARYRSVGITVIEKTKSVARSAARTREQVEMFTKRRSEPTTYEERLARAREWGFEIPGDAPNFAARVRGLKLGDDARSIMTRAEYVAFLRAQGARTRTTIDSSEIGVNPAWFKDVAPLQPLRGGRVWPKFRIKEQTDARVSVAEEGDVSEVAAPTVYGTNLPQSNAKTARVEVPNSRFGAFVRGTKSAFEDSAYLGEIVDRVLTRDVDRQLDHEVVDGDGTGTGDAQHFTGLAHQTLPIVDATSISPSEALISAAATVRGADWQGRLTVVLNVTDAQTLANEKTTEGASILADALASLAFFGITPDDFVLSTVVAQGSSYVGSLEEAATVYVREAPSVAITNSDGNDFILGQQVVKVEGRLGFRLHNASAIVAVQNL